MCSALRSEESSDFEIERHWMIRFAHPFGAILRTFSTLRATSSFRWNDELMHATLGFGCASPQPDLQGLSAIM